MRFSSASIRSSSALEAGDVALQRRAARAGLGAQPRQGGLQGRGRALGRVRRGVVEVGQHRGVVGDSAEDVAEAAQHIGADRVALVQQDTEAGSEVGGADVEVVVPEVGQHLGQLVLGITGADDLLLEHLGLQVLVLVLVALVGAELVDHGLDPVEILHRAARGDQVVGVAGVA